MHRRRQRTAGGKQYFTAQKEFPGQVEKHEVRVDPLAKLPGMVDPE